MLGEIECVRWVSGLPCSQRSRACRMRLIRDIVSVVCLPFFATALGCLQVSSSLSRRHGNSFAVASGVSAARSLSTEIVAWEREGTAGGRRVTEDHVLPGPKWHKWACGLSNSTN